MKRKPGLKKPGQQTTYTYEQIQELIKCQNDPVYFIENYVYIRHAKRGRIKFAMYDYQRNMVGKYHKQRFNIVLSARQTGKTETSCAYLLWFAIFHKDKTILVASNKGSNAMEIIRKIQFAYEELPDWLKPGIDESNWNKHTCTWENASRIVATTTSEDSGRGMSISLLYCDEIAFVKPHTAKKFWDSILPTISTGGGVILSSTPNGDIGLFAETWRQAQAGLNEFKDGVTYVPWNAPPGRDEEFKRKFIGLLGQRKWEQEYECVIGDTLVTVLDTKTGEEIEMPISKLFHLCKIEEYEHAGGV